MLDAAARTVEFLLDHGVALSQHFQQLGQAGPLGPAAAHLVLKKFVAARLGQGVELKIKMLIQRGDARTADQHA